MFEYFVKESPNDSSGLDWYVKGGEVLDYGRFKTEKEALDWIGDLKQLDSIRGL